MKDTYSRRSPRAYVVIALLTTLVVSFAIPLQVFAADASSQTAQLLPPNAVNTCAPVQVSTFTPYVYEGALHAFDFTVSDSSYVAIGGTVGNTSFPFSHYVRNINPGGSLRVHADLPTTPIRGNLAVTVTMLSAKGPGQPVCVSVVTATVESAGVFTAAPVAPATPLPTTPTAPTAPTTPAAPTEPSTPITEVEVEEEDATTTATSVSPIASAGSTIAEMCAEGGALRLWIVLLVVYALIVGGVILGQPKLPSYLQSQEWAATAIVVPFLLLFGFWYFAEGCRTSAWIPVIATVIALAGLAAAFWDRKDSNVINLPSARS